MEAAIMMAVFALISAIGNGLTNYLDSSRQQQHDKDMAQIQFENEKALLDYQNNLQQDTNMISTQKGHAVAAGYSPALLYGSSMPTASISGGSSSASASALPALNGLFQKVAPDSAVSAMFTQKQQEMNLSRINAQNARDTQEANLAAMRTARETYDLGMSKRLQQTIIDKSLADLELTRANAANQRFIAERGAKLLPGELEAQGLINSETAAKIEKINSEVQLNGFQMREIQANINRLSKLNEVSDAEISNINESVKRSALGRIMQEFGLNGHKILPAQLRNSSELYKALNDTQMKGAYIALRNMGFSEFEATNAVIYYTATDPKDVSPSLINGAARIFSSLIPKTLIKM